MVRLAYNSQLNTKPVIFKFFTPWEFFIGLILAFSIIAVPIVAGLKPSFLDTVIVFSTYTLFLVYFKIGKPDGYVFHWLSHFVTPTVFRPGHKAPAYPIKPELAAHMAAVTKTPKERWDHTRQLQSALLEANLMPNGSYGNYLQVENTDVRDAAQAFLASGGVLSVDSQYTDVSPR